MKRALIENLNISSAGKRIPCIVCNLEVNFHIYMGLPIVPAFPSYSLRYISIYSSHLGLVLESGRFLSGFSTKTVRIAFIPCVPNAPPISFLLDLITFAVTSEVHKTYAITLCEISLWKYLFLFVRFTFGLQIYNLWVECGVSEC
jgi:hypothetical protein